MSSSSPSWSSSALPEDYSLPQRQRDSPSPAASGSSSSSEDRVPLSVRALRRAPPMARPVARSVRRSVLESPDAVASTVTSQELSRIRAIYKIPDNVRLYVPTPDDRVISSRPGRVALYEAFLKAGLRLPLHPLLANIFDFYSLTPSQLVPNSVRTLCSFVILCHLEGVEARVSLFRSFYTLRQQSGWWVFQPRPSRALRLGLPTSIKGWKSRYFFADVGGGKPGWGSPNVGPNQNNLIIPGDREAFGRLQTADIPTCKQLLTEANLQLAGLLPSGGMKIPHSMIRRVAGKKKRKDAGGAEPPRKKLRAPSPSQSSDHSLVPAPPLRPPRSEQEGLHGGPSQVSPVDLTADTPPEGVPTEGALAPPQLIGTGEAATATHVEEEGPSSAAVPEKRSPSAAPSEGEAEALPAHPFPEGRGSIVGQTMGRLRLPGLQEELQRRGAKAVVHDVLSAQLWTANSLLALQDMLARMEESLRHSCQCVDEAEARAAKAEEALTLALEEQADSLRKIRSQNDAEIGLLRGRLEVAESTSEAQSLRVQSMSLEVEAMRRQASLIEESLRASEARAAEVAQEADRRVVAAEGRVGAAEEKVAAAEARAAKAVDEFRESAAFAEELAEASADAYLLGFQDGKRKVGELHHLSGLEDIEPDEVVGEEPEAPVPTPGDPSSDGPAEA